MTRKKVTQLLFNAFELSVLKQAIFMYNFDPIDNLGKTNKRWKKTGDKLSEKLDIAIRGINKP